MNFGDLHWTGVATLPVDNRVGAPSVEIVLMNEHNTSLVVRYATRHNRTLQEEEVGHS